MQRLDGKEEQRIMMLNNGCLCCTVREDLVGMLNELVSSRAFGLSDALFSFQSRQRSSMSDGTDVKSRALQIDSRK